MNHLVSSYIIIYIWPIYIYMIYIYGHLQVVHESFSKQLYNHIYIYDCITAY